MDNEHPLSRATVAGKTREVRFLVDQFDMLPTRAGAVIAHSETEAQHLATRVTAEMKVDDTLADKPVPDRDADRAHRETHSAEFEKPVVHRSADQT